MSLVYPQEYYSRYDKDKKYVRHLYRAGYAVQSAEFNEMQQAQADQIKDIADAILSDGSLVKDGASVVNEITGECTCSAGSVYIDGRVHKVDAKTFTIPTSGTITIGIYLKQIIVTELEDPSLRDPAVGTANFEQAGACRLKLEAEWGFDGQENAPENSNFYPIYTADDGVLRSKEPPPQLDSVTQAIASYDRESSGGSYVVSGLTVRRGEDAEDKQVWNIEEGRARVNGTGVTLPTSRRVLYQAIPDLQSVETEVYVANGNANQVISLAYYPIYSVDEVKITIEVTEQITHGGYTGAVDLLQHTGVVSVQEVKSGGVTYALNSDYVLSGNAIDWSPSGQEPATGASYSVTYRYITNITPTEITNKTFTIAEQGVSGTQILVSYKWKMPRIDRLCIDSEGVCKWVQGVSAVRNPLTPNVPNNLLSLATISQFWDDRTSVTNDSVRVIEMSELNKINSRIDSVVALVTQQRLEASANLLEAGQKKGLLVDAFNDDSIRDIGQEQNAVIYANVLQLPIDITAIQPSDDVSQKTALNANLSAVLSQTAISGNMQINPYLAFDVVPAQVSLNPAIDRWTQTSAVVIDGGTVTVDGGRVSLGGGGSGWAIFRGYKETTTATSSQVLSKTTKTLENLRSISVAYNVKGFGANEVLSELIFDGIKVNASNTIANASGVLSGTFTIPSGIPAGSKKVEFNGAGGSHGEAIFVGQGTLTTEVRRTITTISRVAQYYDPVAQTFILDDAMQIGGIDVFIDIKGTTNIELQIRNVENGFPNREIIASVVKPINEIVAKQYNRFEFDAPIFLNGGQEYAVVCLCNDAVSAVGIAELGKWDATNKQWIASQPYQVGLMFSSSNGSTWTAHQDKDLCFKVLQANYAMTTREINLGTCEVENATDLVISSLVENPNAQTSVKYTLELTPTGSDRANQTYTLAEDQAITLDSAFTGTATLKATLYGTANYSPILYNGTWLLTGKIGNSGTYISRAVQAGQNVRVKVIYDALLPSGASVNCQIKGNATGENPNTAQDWTDVPQISSSPTDDGYYEIVREISGQTFESAAVKLILNGSTIARPMVKNLRVMIL